MKKKDNRYLDTWLQKNWEFRIKRISNFVKLKENYHSSNPIVKKLLLQEYCDNVE